MLNGIPLAIRKLSGDRIVPANIDAKEPWIIPPGGIIPVWIKKLTGRYVDPSIEDVQQGEIEMHQHHDVVSMETVSEDRTIPKHHSSEFDRE